MIKLKVEKVDLYSNILEKEMSMLVYLPQPIIISIHFLCYTFYTKEGVMKI